MLSDNIRNKLRTEQCFNPYCDKYSESDALKIIQRLFGQSGANLEFDEEAKVLLETITLLPFFNSWFKDYYRYTLERLKAIKWPMLEILNFQLALHNRNIAGIFRKTVRDLEVKNITSLEESYGHTIDSIDPSIKVSSTTAAESSVDSLGIILNFYRYFIDEKTSDENPSFFDVSNFCFSTDIRTQIYHLLKGELNNFIWSNGYVKYEAGTFKFQWLSHDRIINHQIGHFRLDRNSLGAYYIMMGKMGNDISMKSAMSHLHNQKTKNTRIKKVWTQNNYAMFELESGMDEQEFSKYLKLYSEMASYYNFLENVPIPHSPDLKIIDFIELYAPLKSLFGRLISDSEERDQVRDFDDAKAFPTRILMGNLRAYLLKRTQYNHSQIDFFISIITQKDLNQRINFWDTFFVQKDQALYFSLLPIAYSEVIYCLDNWMEKCGIDLDFRGRLFEKYLKTSLTEELQKINYQFIIPSVQKLVIGSGEYEEVDLVINLKNKIILAELKCVKFPRNHVDFYNTEKRLRDGATQAIRKKNFIVRNRTELTPLVGDISNKEIVAIVISNCPMFTGYEYFGIPVVDYFLVEAYFNTGAIGLDRIETSGWAVTSIDRVDETKFYNNEQEFGNNFMDHMCNPPAILKLRDLIEVKDYPVSHPNLKYKILV